MAIIIANSVENRRPLKRFTLQRDPEVVYKKGYGITVEGVKCKIVDVTRDYVYLLEYENSIEYIEYKNIERLFSFVIDIPKIDISELRLEIEFHRLEAEAELTKLKQRYVDIVKGSL